MLATQQAIVERLACVENNQAQPQQQLQHHPQQQQGVAQPPGLAPLGGLMAPWAGGAMGGQQISEPQDAHQHVAISAGVKANAKQAADLWWANEGAKFFIARRGFNMTEESIADSSSWSLIRWPTFPTRSSRNSRHCPNSQLKTSSLPCQQVRPMAMPIVVNFATFVAVFTETLE